MKKREEIYRKTINAVSSRRHIGGRRRKVYLLSWSKWFRFCIFTAVKKVIFYISVRTNHRYLRKVDCSTHVSLWNTHFNKTRTLVACKKQKQTLGSPDGPFSLTQKWTIGSPDCPLSLFALFCARYLRLLFRVFLQQPLTVLTRQTRQAVCAINQSILDVYDSNSFFNI